jgi:uncharacterized damage-inducible protein DinB
MRPTSLALALAAFTLSSSTASAQAPTTGWRAEALGSFASLERKLVALAEAMPWEKYAWRPADGVRSVCESYLHVVGANYMFVQPLGAKTPANVDLEKIETCPASKAQVVASIKASFAHLRQAVTSTADADADQRVKLFGMDMTKRGVLLFAAEHAGEALGQSIAYARVNGVVPPWNANGGD